jgi:DNA-binding Lrp family transcriptional regulator
VGLVDPAVIGYPVVAFLNVAVTGNIYEVGAALAEVEEIQWVGVATDLQTLLVQASLASNADLLELIDSKVRVIAGVETVSVELGLRSFATAFSFSRLARSQVDSERHVPWLAGGDPTLIDDIDAAILNALQYDGRLTFTELSKFARLSVPATRQRYLRLVDNDLVRIQCRPDLPRIGFTCTATLLLQTHRSSQDVAQRISDFSEAAWVTETTGTMNVRAELICRDTRHLAECTAAIRAIDEVRGAEVLVHQAIIKSTGRAASV